VEIHRSLEATIAARNVWRDSSQKNDRMAKVLVDENRLTG